MYNIRMRYLLSLALLLPSVCRAETVRVVAPYLGSITHHYESSRLDLKDTGALRGVYAQWVNTEKFQANAFFYSAPDVNYSRVDGLHLNADYYLLPSRNGKYAVGGGIESLRVDLKADHKITGYDYLSMKNDILYYYGRAGRYFYFRPGAFDVSVMPYAGYALEDVSGDIYADPAFGPTPPRVSIDDSSSYAIGGVNLNASYNHFLEAQAKWMRRFHGDGPLDDCSLMLNFFFTRRFGVSYRFKYMEETSGSVVYHMGGVAITF